MMRTAERENVDLDRRQPLKDLLRTVRPLLVGGLGAFLLLSISLYNGYPTVFPDSGSYLLTGAFFAAFAPFRAPGYSMFTRFAGLGTSAWFTIAMQAVLIVYVLYEACDYLMSEDPQFRDLCLLVSVCILTMLTSLPWLVSLLMPDVFAGLLFLPAFLLAFAGGLPLIRRLFLSVILAISVMAHMSLFPIAVIFVAAIAALMIAGGRSIPQTKSAAVWLLVPILAAGFCTASLNRKMHLGFKLSPSGTEFLLARLFADGLAEDFLYKSCPERGFISCRYLSGLPRTQEEFLFRHPLLRALTGHEDELEEITRGTVTAYPMSFVKNTIKETLLQLAAVRTGDEIRSHDALEWNASAIQQVFPRDYQRFFQSRQIRGQLGRITNAAALVDTFFFWVSVVACLLLAWTGRFGRVNELVYSAILFLVINAFVCATFSGVFDRYQSRVAWIMPFCLTAYVCCAAKEPERGFVRQLQIRLTPQTDVTLASVEPSAFSLGANGMVALDSEQDAS